MPSSFAFSVWVYFLVDDRVDRDGGLPCLAVADDELPLSAPDRDHPVDGLDARLQRSFTGWRWMTPRPSLDGQLPLRSDGPAAVGRLARGLITRPSICSPTAATQRARCA